MCSRGCWFWFASLDQRGELSRAEQLRELRWCEEEAEGFKKPDSTVVRNTHKLMAALRGDKKKAQTRVRVVAAATTRVRMARIQASKRVKHAHTDGKLCVWPAENKAQSTQTIDFVPAFYFRRRPKRNRCKVGKKIDISAFSFEWQGSNWGW